jgi:hypothetical protein
VDASLTDAPFETVLFIVVVPKLMKVVYAFWLLVLGVCRVSAQQPDVAKANDPLADANRLVPNHTAPC